MKKVLIALGAIVIVIAVGLYILLTNLDTLVKNGIEHYGSEVTQTAVRVKRVKIDLGEGAGGIYGLTVANPKGYAAKQALSLGEASIKINLKSIGKDVIIIDSVIVSAPKVFYEMDANRKGSLNQLYDNVRKSLPARSKDTGDGDAGPKMIIRKVVFKDGAVDARIVPLGNKAYVVKLPAIRMSNLGAPHGATGGVLAKQILSRFIKTARDQVKRQVVDKYVTRELEQKLKGQVGTSLDAEKEKVEQQLKDLIKR